MRICDITGETMIDGFCIRDGEMYIKHEADLIKHLRSLDYEDCNGINSKTIESDDDLKDFFYEDEYYYYTSWEDEQED